MKVIINLSPSLYSFHIYIRSPDCRWGKICAVLDVWVNGSFILSSSLWVACMMLPLGSMTWGVYVIVLLLLRGVFTLM